MTTSAAGANRQWVRYGVAQGIATLVLDDPGRLNPIAPELVDAALGALAELRADASVRVLVLTGSGRAFSAGADLQELAATPAAERGATVEALMREYGHRLLRELRELPVPVVCAVNGAAAGGGVGLALSADIVVAARSAYFYLPFVPALGLVPDMGAAWFMRRALGDARAVALALLGDRLTAEQAAQWGLVWRCVDDAALATEVDALAQRLARLPAHAIAEVRALFRAASSPSLDELLRYESERQGVLAGQPAFEEGLAAFLQRRPPNFRPD